MLDEIKKSINATLYERTASPLYGTLVISWSLWNWKIFYLTMFVSEEKISINKIDYIVNNFSNPHHLITYPVISALVMLTLIPFASNAAFWLTLKFEKWKKYQKNLVENKQLLSIEQSIELRTRVFDIEEKYTKILLDKDSEIKQLNSLIESIKNPPLQFEQKNKLNSTEKELINLKLKMNSNKDQAKEYEKLMEVIQRGDSLSFNNIDPSLVALLESYNVVENLGKGNYKLTEIGKEFNRLIIE